jgi:hypothetical protein
LFIVNLAVICASDKAPIPTFPLFKTVKTAAGVEFCTKKALPDTALALLT